MNKHVILLINLLQDVNVLRPIAYLAAEETDASIVFLVSEAFRTRDSAGRWIGELDRICFDIGASIEDYVAEYDAYGVLKNKSGIIFAGSESHLGAHALTHNVFRSAPDNFLRVTMQHGFECVGFLQNYEQTAVHGNYVTFAADVICGWCGPGTLRSIAPSERSKLYVTGPPSLIQPTRARHGDDIAIPPGTGLICENLHSVRLNVSSNLKAPFIRDFVSFCSEMEDIDDTVAMRPHPGGQYVVKNSVALPDNVMLDNRPMYDVELGKYAFGISAPSSVLIDMLLARIPTAVWRDPDGLIDASNYDGLRTVTGLEDWIRFAADAKAQPDAIVKRQDQFLAGLDMVTDAAEVRARFARLLTNCVGQALVRTPTRPAGVLFLANGEIPSLHISFIRPLREYVDRRDIRVMTLTENTLKLRFVDATGPQGEQWMLDQVKTFDPAMIVACRYSGPHADAIADYAASRGIPLVYHLDDDLLSIPMELGERKYLFHNAPPRIETVTTLLKRADTVYCSTQALGDRMKALGLSKKVVSGDVYCAARTMAPAELRPVRTIGYMGYDHAHDLELAIPALVPVLRANPNVRFDLFGSIPKPPELDEFGDRVRVIPPIQNYDAFLQFFGNIGWDIGICPLADTAFNRVKANTKWVEYTAAGIAVVATGGMMYDECSSGGCGALATTTEEWIAALNRLCADPEARFEQVVRAQTKLAARYSPEHLRDQVTSVLNEAAGRPLIAHAARIEHGVAA